MDCWVTGLPDTTSGKLRPKQELHARRGRLSLLRAELHQIVSGILWGCCEARKWVLLWRGSPTLVTAVIVATLGWMVDTGWCLVLSWLSLAPRQEPTLCGKDNLNGESLTRSISSVRELRRIGTGAGRGSLCVGSSVPGHDSLWKATSKGRWMDRGPGSGDCGGGLPGLTVAVGFLPHAISIWVLTICRTATIEAEYNTTLHDRHCGGGGPRVDGQINRGSREQIRKSVESLPGQGQGSLL